MKRILLAAISILIIYQAFSQNNSFKKIVFIPHPRSEDRVNQTAIKGIEQIDFSKFDMILLGGDLTYYTTIDKISMDHCDNIFNLESENTLWTLGNHDLNNPYLITQYTKRPRSYSYYKDKITFLVLDTEIGSSGFKSSHITDSQIEMIQNVADTINQSKYLILLHHRLLWMIGNEYFSTKIDSVGESTKQLDTSNFNTVIFPLLQKVKNKGIQVICMGGDKSKINIRYSPEDSITYIASTMAPEFNDDSNDVVILTHNLITDTITWEFVPLGKVEKKPMVSILKRQLNISEEHNVTILPKYSTREILLQLNNEAKSVMTVKIFDITGRCVYSDIIHSGYNPEIIQMKQRGIYIVKIQSGEYNYSQKIVL